MNPRITDPEQWVERSYRAATDPAFAEMLRAAGPLEPDELADMIDADASIRVRCGRAVALRRYLSGVPNLADVPVAMDAAIEACFRAAAQNGETDPAGVLIRQHPDLEPQIRRSETLGQLFANTAAPRGMPPTRTLPCELGPELEDGRCRYELRELLGFGAHGSVYLSVDRQLSEPEHPAWVAVKVMRRRVNNQADDRLWRSEATYLRRVMHPNVVRVLDRGCTAQREAFIVHEYVRGRNLRALAEASSGRLSAREAAQLVRDLARGAQAVHSAGLVHCDLKPDNILLDEEGVPRVTDFGVAAPREPSGSGVSEDRLGSPAFMAPEQFCQEPGWLVPSCDIYALGSILYWLLCGAFPNGTSLAEIERNLRPGGRTGAPSARALNRDVPADLDAICRRAMSPDPKARYSSAEMLAADLDAFVGHRPLPWRRYSGFGLLGLLCRRQPLLVGMTAGVSALAMAVAAGALWVHDDHLRREMARRSSEADATMEAARRTNAARREIISAALKTMESLSRNGLGAEWMPIMSGLEALGGSLFMGEPTDPTSAWARRISLAQELVRDAREHGRSGDLEPMVWESALCVWLVRAGRSEEALAILEENRAAWALRLRPDDLWLFKLELLRGCAEAEMALRGVRPGEELDAGAAPVVAELARLLKGGRADERDAVVRLGHSLLAKAHAEPLVGPEVPGTPATGH